MKKLSELRVQLAKTIEAEHDRLVLWLPVLFGLGVGVYFSLPAEPNLWTVAGIAASVAALLAICYRKYALRILLIGLLLTAIGALRAEIRTQEVAAPVLHKTLYFRTVEGVIADIQVREKGEKLILQTPNIEGISLEQTPKLVSVSLKNESEGLAVGDKVRLLAMLFPPPSPAMPRAYDFARMFYYEQLGAVGFSPKPPELLEKGKPSNFDQWLNDLRLSITQRILAPMGAENGWIAAAMMVGEQSGVSKEVADAMRESGIYHILSISGLHMSLAAMLVFVATRFLLTLYPPLAVRLPTKKIAAMVGLISSFAYLLLAGYPVPAVRSFIMVACVMLAILVDRVGISIFSLAWAGLITLLWQPESLLGASFQLSFAATIAIVAFYERCSHLLHRNNSGVVQKIWLYFWGIMLTSLVVTIATTPLVIYHFNRFTLWGIIANMLMLPLASVWIMPAAVISLLAMPFGLEHYPLVALDYALSLMMTGARAIAEMPYASVALPPPSFAGILLVVFGGLWLVIWQQRWRYIGAAVAVLGMATIFLHQPYDLLVSNDGKRVALRLPDSGKLLFLRGKESSFDGQMWLRNDGQDEGISSSDMDEKIGECELRKCVVSAYGQKIVVAKANKKETAEGVCAGSPDIVISSVYLDRVPECAGVKLLIDKAFLLKNGAAALRFNQKSDAPLQIETSRQFRGAWPWVGE